jgi:hypothetical protein
VIRDIWNGGDYFEDGNKVVRDIHDKWYRGDFFFVLDYRVLQVPKTFSAIG